MMKSIGRLEVIAFVSGFALLCFELVAARLLAPSIGSSTYVWTSVIGVIIAALAVGYWYGGIIADKRNARQDIAYLLLASAVAVLFSQVLYGGVLQSVATWDTDPRLQAVTVTVLLFAPASFVLGMLSPYLAKLNVTSLGVSGRRVASLGALNSIGGIVGTFLTGFVLIGLVGSHQLLTVLVLMLVATSWLIAPQARQRQRIALSAFAVISSLLPMAQVSGVRDIDTPSAHYQVIQGTYQGLPITGLTTGPNGVQSAVYDHAPDELVFWYSREMASQTVVRQPERVLMLGGGTFTIPANLAERLPESQIDVVEIDPQLLDIAEKYFQYQQADNVTHYFQDARSYVNQASQQYDVILVDVYGDGSIPFSFTTQEFGQEIAEILTDDGVVIANVIGGLAGGECEDLTRAVDAAYRTQLPYGYYTAEPGESLLRDNLIITYGRQPLDIDGVKPLPFAVGTPLTDNRAPTEQLYHDCREATR